LASRSRRRSRLQGWYETISFYGKLKLQNQNTERMKNEAQVIVGLDIGATKVAAGLVGVEGKILAGYRTPMLTMGAPSDGLAAVSKAIEGLFTGEISRHQVSAIGVCAPGPLEPESGVIINPPNLPIWHNDPLAEEMRKLCDVPVRIDNDANAAVLAESKWGADPGYRNLFYVTIGTGLGTGIIFDGQIFHGNTGAAAEGAHVGIDINGPLCNCGKRGCIETLAAGPAIARRAREKLSQHPGSVLWEMAAGDLHAVTSEMVGRALCCKRSCGQRSDARYSRSSGILARQHDCSIGARGNCDRRRRGRAV
jgi:glucokinase